MPVFKGSIFFEHQKNGWTENFWFDVADAATGIEVLKSYVTQRRKVLSDKSFVKYLRVTNPDPPRDAKFFSYLGLTGQGSDVTDFGGVGSEHVDTAVNFRFTSAAGKWRNLLYRGLPNRAVMVGPLGTTVDPAWAGAWNANVRALLINSEFRIRITTKGDPQAINTITTSAGRLTAVTTLNALVPVPAVGQQIEIKDVTEASNVNGVYQVLRIGDVANQYRLRLKGPAVTGTPNVVAGVVRVLIPSYSAIVDTQPIGATSRQTGRPSYLRRGRRSARRR